MKRWLLFLMIVVLGLSLLMGSVWGAPKIVNIIVWRNQASAEETAFHQSVIDAFNKKYAGKVHATMDFIPRGNSFAYEDKVNAAAAAGKCPDVLSMDGPNVSNYAYSGILEPLDKYVSKADKADFVPSIIQQGTYDGKLYSVGANESTVVLFYNKKMLAAAGITPPNKLENAWSWDQLYDAAKKLTKDGVYGLDMKMDYGVGEWLTYMGSVFLFSNKAKLISNDGKKAEGYVNSPKVVETMKFIQKLAQEKLFNVKPDPNAFENGKAAMCICGTWIISGFSQFKDLEWGITYFPYRKVKKSPSGSWCYGIYSKSAHKKEAALLLNWMTNKDNDLAFCKAVGNPPARKSSFARMTEYNTLPLSVIKDQVMHTAQARPRTPAYPVLTGKFAEAFNDICLGQDVKTSLDKVAAATDEEIKRNYSR